MAELRQRGAPGSSFPDYEAEDDHNKGHPAPAKQLGMGMLIGMAIAAVVIIGFVVYIEEEKWHPDWEMHAKVVEQHKKQKESHDLLNKIRTDLQEKHERGELPVHEPTEEELENARIQKNLREWDKGHHDDHPDAPGMIDALGNQMQDTPYDLKHRMSEFWKLDLNKDAFLTEPDFAHKPKKPSNLEGDAFDKLDTNKDGAVSIREYCAGFHDQVHMREPWYHHKYGYVYGHEIPEHIKDAKVGAVKKGTAEHKAALAGVHPAQAHKKINDKKKKEEMKELNEKAHKQGEIDDAHHDKMVEEREKQEAAEAATAGK